ncbi:MAG: sigma-70 family RNA polymerase sigma factor [Gemmatimonadota bacterium]
MPDHEPHSSRKSFEALLSPLLGAAYGLAVSLAHDGAEAEDLVQEASLLAFRHFSTFRTGTNFKAWFFRILTNAFYAQRRKEKRQPSSVDLDDVPELYLFRRTLEAGLHARSDDPARLVLGRLSLEQMTRAIEALPDEYRVVSALYLLEELTYPEIAEALDVPVGTVRSRLHRGRKMLQKMLWHIAEEEGIVSSLTAEGATR